LRKVDFSLSQLFFSSFFAIGAALEHRTLLGRLLRIAPDMRDQQITALLGESHRQSRAVVEGHLNNLKSRLGSVQTAANDIVMAMLKAGKQYAIFFELRCVLKTRLSKCS
jgi:hypothetical protein